ncbi:MAG: ABC transporter substrate-binding protein [Geodermatophilaceae bacterium]|jgi:ABC-type transport system substrate-binding protein
MSLYRWVDERTLEVRIRRDETFPDGQRLTAESVKQAFDEQIRWSAPHPPGTHFNIDRRTRCEVTGPYKVRFHLPEPDGLVVGKLRATHIMSSRFWRDLGFGYASDESGEGHW